MGSILTDRRVTRLGDGYAVRKDSVEYHVLHTTAFDWVITGPNGQFVLTPDGFAINIPTAEDAVAALLG